MVGRPPQNKRLRVIPVRPVDSSLAHSVGHDADADILRIQFKSGGTYDYFAVPAEKHQEMLKADSIGKYFHSEIRGRHQYERVD
jgi:hypothetical protein